MADRLTSDTTLDIVPLRREVPVSYATSLAVELLLASITGAVASKKSRAAGVAYGVGGVLIGKAATAPHWHHVERQECAQPDVGTRPVLVVTRRTTLPAALPYQMGFVGVVSMFVGVALSRFAEVS